MRVSSLLLTTLHWSFAPIVTQANREGCIDSFAELDYYESQVSSYETVRRYVLCDNTLFDAGSLDPYYGKLLSTSSMLHLRPNLHIQCGATGRRHNNCRFRYGDIHIDGTSFYGVSNGSLDNIVIEGVTFFGSRKHVAFLDKPGDVLFQDCVFKVRHSIYLRALH